MRWHLLPLGLMLASNTHIWGGETHHERNLETGIESWELLDSGVRFSLTQMLPDQARAFFMARGFDRAAADAYAQACVFQTVLHNESTKTIDLRLSDWQVLVGKQTLALKQEAGWQGEWKKRRLPDAARIAFRWAQFPAEQTFDPGDWNQGMTAYPLPRGASFDLDLKWWTNGQAVEAILKGAKCAEDR